jgi:NTP pyrophosphatase (non-canonical NTP hydrolase)
MNQDILNKLRQFRHDRDWYQFHTPKNLAISISVESAELLECFQWYEYPQSKINQIKEEVADIAIFLYYFCHDCGIDLEEEMRKKIEKNNRKYPVEKSRGNANKYSEL